MNDLLGDELDGVAAGIAFDDMSLQKVFAA